MSTRPGPTVSEVLGGCASTGMLNQHKIATKTNPTLTFLRTIFQIPDLSVPLSAFG